MVDSCGYKKTERPGLYAMVFLGAVAAIGSCAHSRENYKMLKGLEAKFLGPVIERNVIHIAE